jgi:hypothetical protein
MYSYHLIVLSSQVQVTTKTKETLRFVVSESVTVAITVKVKTDRHRTLQCTCTGAMRALSSGNERTPVDAEARSS